MEFQELSLDDIQLDFKNPRFSYYNFKNEEQIIQHLIQSENLKELLESIKNNGYNTLGERIIVLKENNTYIVLEGNRRVAALKTLVADNKISHAPIPADIVTNREEAALKIATKHIASIKQWSPTDKRNFYKNQFETLINQGISPSEALAKIKKNSPERKATIKKSIIQFYFVKDAYDSFQLKNQYILSSLDTDIFTNRIYNYLTKKLDITINEETLKVEHSSDFKKQTYSRILSLITKEVWEKKTITTRTANTTNNLEKNLKTTLPDLDNLIIQYTSDEETPKTNVQTPIEQEQEQKLKPSSIDKNKSLESEENEKHQGSTPTSGNIYDKYGMNIKIKNLTITSLPYDLGSNVIILKNNTPCVEHTTKLEFVSSGHMHINNNKIQKSTPNGHYTISVSYKGMSDSFTVNINCPTTPAPRQIIETGWFQEQKKKLDFHKDLNKKIILCLEFLTNVDVSTEFNVLPATASLRSLYEFSARRYTKLVNTSIKIDNNLPGALNSIKNDINKNSKIFDKRQLKNMNFERDIAFLNSVIHYEDTPINQVQLIQIFEQYKSFLEHLFTIIISNQ